VELRRQPPGSSCYPLPAVFARVFASLDLLPPKSESQVGRLRRLSWTAPQSTCCPTAASSPACSGHTLSRTTRTRPPEFPNSPFRLPSIAAGPAAAARHIDTYESQKALSGRPYVPSAARRQQRQRFLSGPSTQMPQMRRPQPAEPFPMIESAL